MKYFLTFVCAGFLLGGCEAPNPLAVSDAYAFATNAANGAVFLTVDNAGTDDALLAADTLRAERVEIHTMDMNGDIMKMRQIDSLPLPAGKETALMPMGAHIMLIGLKEELREGDNFDLRLTFEKAGERVVSVPVIKAGEKPDEPHAH